MPRVKTTPFCQMRVVVQRSSAKLAVSGSKDGPSRVN